MLFWTVCALILIAFIFDYINGFHDAANSIATVVSTRVMSPFIGLAVGYSLMIAIYWLLRYVPPGRVDRWFRRLQLVSAAFFSLNHGGNDAQKTAGIITAVLFSSGYITKFDVPMWVRLG